MSTTYNHILTSRLILRKPVKDDLTMVNAIHGNRETNLYNPAGPHQTLGESKKILNRWLQHWEEFGYGYWTIIKKHSDNSVIGFGGLSPKKFGQEILPNLYYRFTPSAWGKGYATEMAHAALKYGCDLFDFDKIMASVRPDNIPSIKVLNRLGLRKYGETEDQYGVSHLYEFKCS
jgi:RimJ/RimL family protein N-acetyltransferase